MTTDFGKILQKLMIDEDITQKSLAKDLGISPSILSNYITGKNIPEMELAGKIIKRFKLKKNEIKKLFEGVFSSTARHNQKISINTRFLSPKRIDELVKFLTILLMYPDRPDFPMSTGMHYSPPFSELVKTIEAMYRDMEIFTNLEYNPPEAGTTRLAEDKIMELERANDT